MKGKSKLRRIVTSLMIVTLAIGMSLSFTSIAMAADEEPADIQDTYTIEGVTYYNTASDSFATDANQFVKDVMLGQSTNLAWQVSSSYTYNRSMADLWLEAAAGLMRGKDYLNLHGGYAVSMDEAACNGSPVHSCTVGNKSFETYRYPSPSTEMKTSDMVSPKKAEEYLYNAADINGKSVGSTGVFMNASDPDTTFVTAIRSRSDETRIAAVYFNNFKVVALFPEDAGKNYVTSSVEDSHYSDVSASNVKNNTAENISTTQTASRNYSWSVTSSVNGSRSYSLEKSIKVSAEFKFSIFEKLGIEAGVTTTEAFESGWSKDKTHSDDKGTQQEISVDLPPYTNVMMTQKTTTGEYTTRYNCPVGVTFDATVVVYDKNGVCSVDGSKMVFSYAGTGREALAQRYKDFKDESDRPDPDGVRWNYALAFDSTGDTHIGEAIEKATTYIPMSPTGAQFKQTMNVIAGEVAGLMPIYPLKKVKTNARAQELSIGDTFDLSEVSLTGTNEKDAPYYGFNSNKGSWIVVDEEGKEWTENAPLQIKKDAFTGEVSAKAVGPGVCYLKYIIDETAYATAENPESYATNDQLDSTAFIKVTVPYQVTFKYQNGSKDEAVSVKKGETVSEPFVEPVKCKTFLGWFTDEACTEAYDFAAPVTANLTLYAGWKDNHQWSTSYKVDKAATLAAPGSKSIHCTVCGVIKLGSKVAISKLTVKATTLTKVAAAKKGFTAKWKKGSGVTGYELQYALNSKFTKGKKTVKITKAGTVSKKVAKLKAKKKYFVRIRAYKTYKGKKYYSTWSKAKSVKTKK